MRGSNVGLSTCRCRCGRGSIRESKTECEWMREKGKRREIRGIWARGWNKKGGVGWLEKPRALLACARRIRVWTPLRARGHSFLPIKTEKTDPLCCLASPPAQILLLHLLLHRIGNCFEPPDTAINYPLFTSFPSSFFFSVTIILLTGSSRYVCEVGKHVRWRISRVYFFRYPLISDPRSQPSRRLQKCEYSCRTFRFLNKKNNFTETSTI